MYCRLCGTYLEEPNAACPKCATVPLYHVSDSYAGTTYKLTQPTSPSIETRVKIPIKNEVTTWGKALGYAILIFILSGSAILVLMIVVVLGSAFLNSQNQARMPQNENQYYTPTQNDFPQQESRPQPKRTIETKPQVESLKLIDETAFIEAGNIGGFTINLSNDSSVSGSFSVQGNGYDIECFLVDDFEYQNLRNNSSFRAIYQAKRVKQGRFSEQLPAGTYYLVFNNRYSILTPKSISAKVFIK